MHACRCVPVCVCVCARMACVCLHAAKLFRAYRKFEASHARIYGLPIAQERVVHLFPLPKLKPGEVLSLRERPP